MHATEFLTAPVSPVPPVAVLLGNQRHLKRAALARLQSLVIGDDESSLTRFAGRETDLQTVTDELRTLPMWCDRRLVLVDEADEFVSKFRAGLEKYLAAPIKKSVLVLDVSAWPKTTRLAKQVSQTGLEIDCNELKGVALLKWLGDWARTGHNVVLHRDAAALLVELVGGDCGLLDQELAKLAAYAGARRQITSEDVRAMVGGWRTETTWAMTNAVRDGHVADALAALEQLLEAGEPPLKLLGGISFVFRKYAWATERARHVPLETALKEAGVFPQDQRAAAAYLRRIGREKAEHLLTALITADTGLKGASRLPDRLQLEWLLLRLCGAAS
jgi:DNA polymerase-3 subunit delta